MSRHTKTDWITTDERITKDLFDEHKVKLAPPGKLVWKYYRDEITFDEYKDFYLEYLNTIKDEIIDILILPSIESNITVMCIEDTAEFCHRKILLEYSKSLAETLLWKEIEIEIN